MTSKVKIKGRSESSEEKIVELQVMPADEIEGESTEVMPGQLLTTVDEGVERANIDDSRFAMSGFLGESLDVLDDTGLKDLL